MNTKMLFTGMFGIAVATGCSSQAAESTESVDGRVGTAAQAVCGLGGVDNAQAWIRANCSSASGYEYLGYYGGDGNCAACSEGASGPPNSSGAGYVPPQTGYLPDPSPAEGSGSSPGAGGPGSGPTGLEELRSRADYLFMNRLANIDWRLYVNAQKICDYLAPFKGKHAYFFMGKSVSAESFYGYSVGNDLVFDLMGKQAQAFTWARDAMNAGSVGLLSASAHQGFALVDFDANDPRSSTQKYWSGNFGDLALGVSAPVLGIVSVGGTVDAFMSPDRSVVGASIAGAVSAGAGFPMNASWGTSMYEGSNERTEDFLQSTPDPWGARWTSYVDGKKMVNWSGGADVARAILRAGDGAPADVAATMAVAYDVLNDLGMTLDQKCP
ncbi:MAG: hypothetical protein JWP97_6518 [Labilithrix sp.]|nr:hypothetical protein [Labilithrix sp.]